MALEFLPLLMEVSILANGRMILGMEKEDK